MVDYCLKDHLPVLDRSGFIGTQEEAQQRKGGVSHMTPLENISWGPVCSTMVILNRM